jgi:hypothetical protein
MLTPGTARGTFAVAPVEAPGVSLGLIESGGNVAPFPLGLHQTDERFADEEGVVRWSRCRRPFGDRHPAPAFWSNAGTVAKGRRVHFPSGLA